MKFLKDIKIYMPFAINSFQRNLSYRANAIIFILGDGMMLIVSYYLWLAIYSSSSKGIINGFTFSEMIIYILISALTALVIENDVGYRISSEVKDGSIAINLIKPINYEKRMLFEGIGNVFYSFIVAIILGTVGMGIILYNNQINLSLKSIIPFLFSIVLSILLNFYYSYIFGLLSFKLTNMWGISQIMNAIIQLLSGMLIPLVFFPNWVQGIFKLLPFSSMIYTPTMIYLGKLTGNSLINALIIQIIWIIILKIVAGVIWSKSIKQLVILGG